MPSRFPRIFVALGLTAAMAAACGDDGDGTTVGATGPSGSSSSSAGPGSGGGGSGGSSSSSSAGGSGGASSDTWDNYAMGFFETYCWECHGAGDPLRDYTLLSAVMAESVSIRCGVTPNALSDCTGFPPPAQFPIDNATSSNPKPSDSERTRLVQWIEAGTP